MISLSRLFFIISAILFSTITLAEEESSTDVVLVSVDSESQLQEFNVEIAAAAAAARPERSISVRPKVVTTTRRPFNGRKTITWSCVERNSGYIIPDAWFQIRNHNGVQYSGGHLHGDGSRPLGEFSAVDGNANAGYWTMTYTASEVGGEETFTMTCGGFGIPSSSLWTIYTEIPALIELPPNPQLYALIGEEAGQHLDNHFGTETFINSLVALATDFINQFPGDEIQYNDISLVYGGIFDFDIENGNEWNPPHRTHRWGDDVDIRNRDVPPDQINYIMNRAQFHGLRWIDEGVYPPNHLHFRQL